MDLGFNQYTSGGKIGVRIMMYVCRKYETSGYLYIFPPLRNMQMRIQFLSIKPNSAVVYRPKTVKSTFTTFNELCPTGRTLLWVMKNIYIVTEIFFDNFLAMKKNGR